MPVFQSNAVIPFGTKYGVIPGSDSNSPYGAGYKGVYSMMAPQDPMLGIQQAGAEAEIQRQAQKFDLLKGLFSNMRNFEGSAHFTPAQIPAPHYTSAGPVWSQGQIDAQSNLQRNNLLSQATNQSRDFAQAMGSRGFSPFSPFAMLNQQSNLMRVNAGAAANETNLNFNAAKANSDARLQAGGINANLQGDYMRSLASARQGDMDFYSKQQQQQLSLMDMLLKGMA